MPSLLKPAKNQTRFAKVGLLGFAGSGKTRTSVEIAVGLALTMPEPRRVAFFDTETGSDHVIRFFEDNGIELLVAKSRAFADLVSFMREAEAEGMSAVIVDSVTHVWRELMEAYRKRFRVDRLSFHHWGTIKQEWYKFTDAYLNSQMHAIMCGRAAWEYDFDEDDQGRKELVKTGIKMSTEKEFGFEPSLLIQMEAFRNADLKGITPRAFVIKDRSDTLMGKTFDYPNYATFQPFWNSLAIGTDHIGVETDRTSEHMFESPDTTGRAYQRQREIALENIKNAFVEADLDGNSAANKKKRLEHLKQAFGVGAWTAIEAMKLPELEVGLEDLLKDLGLTSDSNVQLTDEDIPE